MIQDAGFEVIEAADADEAIRAGCLLLTSL